MSKKLYFLMSFVLVASLAGNVLALDMCPPAPDFAGGPTAAAVLWEFEDGNAASGETNDVPTLILYQGPQPPDACFGFRNYGWGYEGAADANNRFVWNTNGTVLLTGEESVCQPIPAGEGDNLTVEFQVTWQGPNYPAGDGPALGLELWGAYPNAVPVDDLREGDWLDGWSNEEGTIDVPPIAEVNNVEGVWRHTTYRHTFENIAEEATHTNIIFFGYEQGTAGMLIDEVVVDMVVHDGDNPPVGPGRPCLRIPRAGQARNPVPANNEEHVLVDVNLAWAPDPCLLGPLKYDVYFGTDSNMANNPKIASSIDPCTVDPAGDLAYGTVYYWRVDTNDANGAGTTVLHTGIDWNFTTLGLADDESPADGEVGVSPSVILSWVEDDHADSRDIYFDTNEAAVTNATTANTATYPGVYRGSTAPLDPCDPNRNTYDPPEVLDLLTESFWRIDEVNSSVAVEGIVWSFTSASHFVVDDFEPYLNTTAVKAVWKDLWWGGSFKNNDAEVFLETDGTLVNGGDKSMRFAYRNYKKTGPKYAGSAAVADISALQAGSDWTRQGVKALVLYFYGDPTNGTDHVYSISVDQMYVELEDGVGNSGIVKYDKKYNYDMNDIKEAEWHEWNIGLADPCLADVNLANVTTMYIGFGGEDKTGQSEAGAGGSTYIHDTVWFDDIQLHPPRCVPVVSLPYGDSTGPYSGGEEPGPTDGDCIIDYWDVLLMSQDWLVTDYEVPPVAPNDANLLVEYLFDTDFSDTSNNGRTGVPSIAFTPTVSAGVMNVTSGGYVDVPFGASNPFDGSKDYSIFITYSSSTQAQMALMTSVDPCMATTWDDPNIDTEASFLYYSPMMVYVIQAHSGGPSNPDDLTFVHDNFYKAGANIDKTVQGGIGSWHFVAATYDADGGICPDDADPNLCTPGQPTGLVTVYLDGTPGPDPANFDPNIPVDSIDDVVRIGTSINALHMEDIESVPYVGDINDIRVYDMPLTHAEVLWLGGVRDMTYFPNTSPANLVLKVPPGAPFDANNVDIVNFRDYRVMADNWLDEILWP